MFLSHYTIIFEGLCRETDSPGISMRNFRYTAKHRIEYKMNVTGERHMENLRSALFYVEKLGRRITPQMHWLCVLPQAPDIKKTFYICKKLQK